MADQIIDGSNKIIDHNKMIRDQITSIVSICKIVTRNINHFNTTQLAIDQWSTSQAKKDKLKDVLDDLRILTTESLEKIKGPLTEIGLLLDLINNQISRDGNQGSE